MTNGWKVPFFTCIVSYLASLTIKSLLPLGQGLFYIEYAETGTVRPSSFELRTRCNVNSSDGFNNSFCYHWTESFSSFPLIF